MINPLTPSAASQTSGILQPTQSAPHQNNGSTGTYQNIPGVEEFKQTVKKHITKEVMPSSLRITSANNPSTGAEATYEFGTGDQKLVISKWDNLARSKVDLILKAKSKTGLKQLVEDLFKEKQSTSGLLVAYTPKWDKPSDIPSSSAQAAPTPISPLKDGPWHEVLGVNPSASAKEILMARNKLLLLHHPDKNPDNKEVATENTSRIFAAAQEGMKFTRA